MQLMPVPVLVLIFDTVTVAIFLYKKDSLYLGNRYFREKENVEPITDTFYNCFIKKFGF